MPHDDFEFKGRVTLDTLRARQAGMQLNYDLGKLLSETSVKLNTDSIVKANKEVIQLQQNLKTAMNPVKGTLDLAMFDTQLERSNRNLVSYAQSLSKYGRDGADAYLSLTRAISSAEAPTTRLSQGLKNAGEQLKRTIGWQLSSSAIHGVMSTYSQAIGYAKELNRSLTDIRIVTGQSQAQMAQFAKQANAAAKGLSSTTTRYTDAALIYYQQGLSEKQVKDRTDVTIKMANVAGVSAEKASQQLTAIWNNFDNGTKSLEHYADVMVKLGAETASSTDEISRGIQKFAAIGNTVGLSYEYAASALATVTATTRESADTVGTSFRTLFSRLQGLSLGQTLEDGTTLNKYSKALDTIGVRIKETNGDMRSMNDILDDIGSKWKGLNKDTQIGLAQSIGGARQYATFMALMDNWDYFEQNVQRANNAAGALEEQQKIYAESWEAASDRARASMESIFSQLLDDEFFIDITNGFATMLDSISSFIEGMGGIKPLLIGLGSILLKMFAGQIEPALQRMRANLEVIFTGSSKTAERVSKEMRDEVDSTLKTHGGDLSAEDKQQLISAQQMSAAKDKILAVEKQLTPLEKQRYEFQLEILQKEQENVQSLIKENEEKKKAVNLAKEELALAKNKLHQTQSTQIDMDEAEKVAGATREAEETSLKKKFDKKREIYQQTGSEEDLTALIAAKEAWTSHMDATEKARYSLESFMGISKQAYDAEMQATQGHIASSDAVVNVSKAFDGYIEDLNKMLTTLDPTKISETKNALVDIESALEIYGQEYAKCFCDKTRAYPGIYEVIQLLKKEKFKL